MISTLLCTPVSKKFRLAGDSMKSRTEYLTFNLPARMALQNITPEVERIVRESGVREGLCLVNPKHRCPTRDKMARWFGSAAEAV